MEELKLYCVVSREAVEACKGVRGKMATQAGHAYCGALLDAMDRFPERAKAYIDSEAVPKITLVADEAQLHELWRSYKDKFGIALIRDAGRTVFKGPTITALGIGPILGSEREELLTQLRPWT
jgi:peptidyl-tRNA hydrolase